MLQYFIKLDSSPLLGRRERIMLFLAQRVSPCTCEEIAGALDIPELDVLEDLRWLSRDGIVGVETSEC